MNKILNATLGNKPVVISINPTVALKLAKKGLLASQVTKQETVAFKLPGDHLGIELVSGTMAYSECHSWYFNISTVGASIVEMYISWVAEPGGKVKLGLTELFYYSKKELDSVIF